ncbi:hypothetical protein, partial [Candidatus Clavichlamydia salmonicola]|uniref:hypothetical protein n=1 Tax=Candidatus Clavichlamydia salmonicola TaxID=469812 RepID=UPI001890F2C4
MPYFIINYLTPTVGSEASSFIIEEAEGPLSSEKISLLNELVQQIISKHMPCAAVPVSFPLDLCLHQNTLAILQDVMIPLIESFNEAGITSESQGPIEKLNNIMNLCFFRADLSSFQQDLPSINPPLTTVEAPLQSNTTFLQRSIKRIGSPLMTSLHNKKIHLDIEENSTSFSSNDSLTSLEELFKLPEADFLPVIDSESFFHAEDNSLTVTVPPTLNTNSSQSTTEFICINILEGNKHFQFTHIDPMDPNIYLEHLYQGIDLVLTNQIYLLDPSDENSQQHSPSYLHHQSLLLLLSLLNKQKHILSLIVDKNEWMASTAHHELLTKEITLSLQDVGFTQKIIETTEKETFPKIIKEQTDIQDKVAVRSNILTEKSLAKENIFLTPTCLSNGMFQIYIKKYHRLVHPSKFIKKIKNYLKNAIGYTCNLNIKEIPLKWANSKTETLKIIYLLTKNNYFFFKEKSNLKTQTHSEFLLLLDLINNNFCTHVKEKVNPSAHSKILLDLITPYGSPISSSIPIKTCACTHYHMRLYTIHNQTTFCIEKHLYLQDTWNTLLRYKHICLKSTLTYIKKLLTLTSVNVTATDNPILKSEKNADVAALIPSLYLLTKYNQQMFKKYLEPLYPTLNVCSKIYIILEDILKTLANSNLNKDISLSKTDFSITNNPLLEINTPAIISKKQHFIGHAFVIQHYKNRYHIHYTTKLNQSFSGLKDKLSFSLNATIKSAHTLLNCSSIDNITFIPDPFNPKNIHKITTIEELLLILHQGLYENFFYYTKHNIFSKNGKKLTEVTNIIDALKQKSILLGLTLPLISNASILNQLTQNELKRDPHLAEATVNENKGPLYLLPLLTVQKKNLKNHSSLGEPSSIFTLSYHTQCSTLSPVHAYGNGRYSISKTSEHIATLCDKHTHNNFIFHYKSPLVTKKESIDSKKMLILLFQGLNDSISFFKKYYKDFTICPHENNPLQTLQKTLALVTHSLDGDIPSTSGPSMLEQVLKDKISKTTNAV